MHNLKDLVSATLRAVNIGKFSMLAQTFAAEFEVTTIAPDLFAQFISIGRVRKS